MRLRSGGGGEKASSCNWMLCLCAAYILLMCARGTCVQWLREGVKAERGGSACVCVCERRALLLFRAIRYPSAGPWLMLHFFNKL